MALDSAHWRRLAWLGATRGPRLWLRASPPPIGLIAAALSTSQRARVRYNLQSLLGHRNAILEHIDVARTFVHFAQSLAESLSLQGHKHDILLRVTGEEHLRDAVARRQGVILGTVHSAGWEAALMSLEKDLDVPVVVAMRSEREPGARGFHPVSNASPNRKVLVVGDDPLASLPLLQHLRAGGIVAVQLDRCPAGMKSIEVQAGRRTWTVPAGPFALAAASGAPIVLALATRNGFLSYDLRITRPVTVPQGQPLLPLVERVVREMASHVQGAPTQWFDFAPG
jgi:lauroyl/myristoyl acyltransferase